MKTTPEMKVIEAAKEAVKTIDKIVELNVISKQAIQFKNLREALTAYESKERERPMTIGERYPHLCKVLNGIDVSGNEQSDPIPEPVPESKGKTKEEILAPLTQWQLISIQDSPYTCHIKADQALKAMQLYASQEVAKATSSLQSEIEELKEKL